MTCLLMLVCLTVPIRSWGGDASVTIHVKKFQIQGFVAYPELGVTEQTLQQQISAILHAHQQKPFTLEDLYAAADTLGQWLQDKGLNFHYVNLPPQDIQEGIVTLQVIAGVLSDIDIRDARLYAISQLQAPLQELLNQPIVQTELDESLLLLSDFSGIDIFSYFSRGSKTNGTRLNVKVRDEQAFETSLRLDNYGTTTTGEYRALGQITANNSLGLADQISLGVLQTASPTNSRYGFLRMELPLINPRHWVDISVSNNRFIMGDAFESLDLDGDATLLELGWRYKWQRSRYLNQNVQIELHKKESTLNSGIGTDIFNEDETTQGIAVRWFGDQQTKLFSQQWEWMIYNARYTESPLPPREQNFSKTFLRWQPILNVETQYFWSSGQWAMTVSGQYSTSPLPSIERIPLTGPYAIRAFEAGASSADRAGITSLEWRWAKGWQFGKQAYAIPMIFVEQAYGELLQDDNQVAQRMQPGAAGVGLYFGWRPHVSGSLVGAIATQSDVGPYTPASDNALWAQIGMKW